MTQWLRQSTQVTIEVGPFVDSTNGNDEETGLTIAYTDVYIRKHGSTTIAAKADTTGATHRAKARYTTVLGTGDTDTLGHLRVGVHVSGALYVWENFMVVPANIFDSFFSTDRLQVDTREVSGTTQTAGDIVNILNNLATDEDVAAAVAAQASFLLLFKWFLNKLDRNDMGDGTIQYKLYDDDNSTVLKTWVYTTASEIRAKAT